MKQHLISLFKYNDWANRRLLNAIKQLPDTEEAAKLFYHLISSQNKWMNRFTKETDDNTIAWFGDVPPVDQFEDKWSESLAKWLNLLECSDDQILEKEVVFYAKAKDKNVKVSMKDLMLQLNYHSIHHRAQINTIIRKQGQIPPMCDYILTAIKDV